MVLKVSKKSYINHLWEILFYFVLCLSLPLFFSLKENDGTFEFIVKVAFVAFILLCVPAILLFFRYVMINKNVSVYYESNRIKVTIGVESKIIDIKEVNSVTLYLTAPVYFKGFRFFPTDSFLYAIIQLKSGEQITITTLIDIELFDTKLYF